VPKNFLIFLKYMGLDIVELVMAYEEAFKIQIPDEEAPRLSTMGSLHEFIVKATRSKNPAPEPEFLWKRMVEIASKQLAVDPSLIKPNTRFIEDLGCG